MLREEWQAKQDEDVNLKGANEQVHARINEMLEQLKTIHEEDGKLQKQEQQLKEKLPDKDH